MENEMVLNEKVQGIVAGVARKYGEKFGIERSDLEQELWVKLLEESERSKKVVENPKLAARTSYNKAVDVYRYERRRWDSKADMVSDEAVSSMAREVVSTRNPMLAIDPFRQPESFLEIKSIVDEFEVGSKARQFVVIKAYIEGIFTLEEVEELEPELDSEKLETMENSEHRIARELGWSSSGSGSYRTLKKRVRKIVGSYFGN